MELFETTEDLCEWGCHQNGHAVAEVPDTASRSDGAFETAAGPTAVSWDMRELAAVRLTAVDVLPRSKANSSVVRKLFEGLPDNVSGAELVADDELPIGMLDVSIREYWVCRL